MPRARKFGQAPPPSSFGQNPKEQQFFLRRRSPSLCLDIAGLDLDLDGLPHQNMTLGSVLAFLKVLKTIVKDAFGGLQGLSCVSMMRPSFFSFFFFISKSERWECEV